MGKRGRRVMKWQCVICRELMESKSSRRPKACPFCGRSGTMKFYGAKVVSIK